MVLGAALGGAGHLVIEHELDVIVAIGDFHVDPIEALFGACAAPDFFEAEDVAVELHGGFELADQDAEVHHAVGEAGSVEGFAAVQHGPAVGFVLDDFEGVAVGVLDVEIGVFDAAFADFIGDFDALGAEVGAHGFGVIDFDGDVIEAVGFGLGFGEEFDVLMVVDFDEGEREFAVGHVEEEDLFVAKEIAVVLARLFDVVDVEGDVGDAEDFRAFGRGLGGEEGC